MTRRQKKTLAVEAFVEARQNDPVWVAKEKKRNEELDLIAALRNEDEKELVRELNECGCAVSSIYDLVNGKAKYSYLPSGYPEPYSFAYPILLKHLDLPHEFVIRQGIIRSLTVKGAGDQVESALLRHFGTEKESTTRWVFANALRVVMPLKRRKKYPEIENAFRNP